MANAQETLKNTAEQYATAGAQTFKDGVEKSLAALNDINAQSKQNLEAVVASVTAATLSGAKSIQEVVELQTAFAKTAVEAYLAELNRASEVVSASVKESLVPLNGRVTATVEKFQAAR